MRTKQNDAVFSKLFPHTLQIHRQCEFVFSFSIKLVVSPCRRIQDNTLIFRNAKFFLHFFCDLICPLRIQNVIPWISDLNDLLARHAECALKYIRRKTVCGDQIIPSLTLTVKHRLMILACRMNIIQVKRQLFERCSMPCFQKHHFFALFKPRRLSRIADNILRTGQIIYITEGMPLTDRRMPFHLLGTLIEAPDVMIFISVCII